MKYFILEDFKGSHDGRITESFLKGEVRELSEYLAGMVCPNLAKPVTDEISNKAIITDGAEKPVRGRKLKQ